MDGLKPLTKANYKTSLQGGMQLEIPFSANQVSNKNSGNGPWINNSFEVNVYRPLSIYRAREFYSPKYNIINKTGIDERATIFWEANLVTDENEVGKISFYTADLPSSYVL